MDELAKPAIEAIKNGDLKFVPRVVLTMNLSALAWRTSVIWCISRADLVGTPYSGILL